MDLDPSLIAFLTPAEKAEALRCLEAMQPKPGDYPTDPVGYARDILGIRYLWDVQADILRALHEPPHKVMVKAAHSTGKTFLAALAVNHWYDSFDPSVAISTAPTERDVVDLLWTEVRLQRARAKLGGMQPSAPEMRTSPDHYAKGYTARDGTSFQGRHRERMLFVFDEAIGVEAAFWNTTKTMFKPGGGHAWLVIFNPTDTTSQAYQEEQAGGWHVFSMSALDHPNVLAGMDRRRGGNAVDPIDAAVDILQVDDWIRDWCEEVDEREHVETDLQWCGPDGVMRWHRPGGEMEARGLGLWPSLGTYGVWSESLWRRITELRPGESERDRMRIAWDDLPQIGNDVARFGDDDTTFHVRWGNTSFHHEAVNGWATTQTTGRCIELAREYADKCNAIRERAGHAPIRAEEIPIKVDDEGVGGAVVDMLSEQGFNVVPVRASRKAWAETKYPNKRSELWFATANKAKVGGVWLGRLDPVSRAKLQKEALSPRWKLDSRGRRVVEKKDETKKKLGRSPDNVDSMNLSFLDDYMWEAPSVIPDAGHRQLEFQPNKIESRAKKRGLFGRGRGWA